MVAEHKLQNLAQRRLGANGDNSGIHQFKYFHVCATKEFMTPFSDKMGQQVVGRWRPQSGPGGEARIPRTDARCGAGRVDRGDPWRGGYTSRGRRPRENGLPLPLRRAAVDVAAEIVRRRVQERGFEMQRCEAAPVEQDWWMASKAGRFPLPFPQPKNAQNYDDRASPVSRRSLSTSMSWMPA